MLNLLILAALVELSLLVEPAIEFVGEPDGEGGHFISTAIEKLTGIAERWGRGRFCFIIIHRFDTRGQEGICRVEQKMRVELLPSF